MIATRMRNKLKIGNVTVKTSAGDVTMVNEGVVVVLKDSGAATAVTLTPSPQTGDFVFIVDAKGDAATNNITVSGAAAETINGAASYTISENYGAVGFVYNGTEWSVVGSYGALSAAELAFLNGVTAGTAAASKAVVLDSSSNVTGVGRLGVDGLRYEDIGTLAPAGTVQANAAVITQRITTSTGDDTAGVVLPTAVAGDEYYVYNLAATAGLKVYPAANDDINDGTTNAAIVIEGKTFAHFIALDTTTWAAIYTANA